MYLHYLELESFRKYKKHNLNLCDGINIILGKNAQGKSTLIEAIYLLATSKSYRTSKDIDMIAIDAQFCKVSAKIKKQISADIDSTITISRREKKKFQINGTSYQKIGDGIGKINAVIFSSNDIDMIKGEPSLRRRFLNLEISQISSKYITNLSRYKRALKQRNTLLKSIEKNYSRKNELEQWNQMLTSCGAALSKSRAIFIKKLSEKASRIYSQLAGDTESFKMTYKSGFGNIDFENLSEAEINDIFLEIIGKTIYDDISRQITSRGAHRDDIGISINNMNVRSYASQGQLRTAAIALKIAEMELFFEYTSEMPIMLLDDIMAELDDERRKNILSMANTWQQTIITSASGDDFDFSCASAVFEVNDDDIVKIK